VTVLHVLVLGLDQLSGSGDCIAGLTSIHIDTWQATNIAINVIGVDNDGSFSLESRHLGSTSVLGGNPSIFWKRLRKLFQILSGFSFLNLIWRSSNVATDD
jgi:hypothetical protein